MTPPVDGALERLGGGAWEKELGRLLIKGEGCRVRGWFSCFLVSSFSCSHFPFLALLLTPQLDRWGGGGVATPLALATNH